MLYLLRHGETVWNVEGRFQGAKDSALTPRGREQAEALGRILASLVPSSTEVLRAYVSPLGRARETAEIVGRYVPLDMIDEPRLREVTLGSWDGLTKAEIAARHPELVRESDRFDWYFRSPDGESFESARARVAGWLSDVRPPAAVIAHGLLGRILRGVYLGLSGHEMLRLPVPDKGLYELGPGGARLIVEAESQRG
jgi:probable phosphoglycerate mutase